VEELVLQRLLATQEEAQRLLEKASQGTSMCT